MVRRLISAGLCLLVLLLAMPGRAEGVQGDFDHDGLNDDFELWLAKASFPRIRGALSTLAEECPGPFPHPTLVRVRPLRFGGVPDYDRLAITYIILYAADCGFLGHNGDAEGFTLFLRRDPAWDSGYRVEGVYAIAHKDTAAEKKSLAVRSTNWIPEVWVSTGKHGNYAYEGACNLFDHCSTGIVTPDFAFLNVGESWAHLSNHITDVALVAGADPLYFNTHPWDDYAPRESPQWINQFYNAAEAYDYHVWVPGEPFYLGPATIEDGFYLTQDDAYWTYGQLAQGPAEPYWPHGQLFDPEWIIQPPPPVAPQPPPQIASFLTPANGTATFDRTQAITWTSAPGAQAYYLYIGTFPGLKDVVDTGEIQQTSYIAPNLPVNIVLYARLYTKVNDVWYSADIFFAAAPPPERATFITPSSGATNTNLALPFQWTPVGDAEAYYLYVGTGLGLKDLVDTGEIQQTSYVASNLPSGQTLYARIHTRRAGSWYHSDISFSGAPRATFTAPSNGAGNVDLSQPIAWTSVPNAEAYYLDVGTAVGLKDFVDTGEILQTSYVASGLPANQALYARIWTKVAGTWSYSDISFSGAQRAKFVTPTQGATTVDLTEPIRWTSIPNAQAYYLYVGTAVGLKNIVDTGEISQTSYAATSIPPNQTVHARIWTKLAGSWYYEDISFSGVRKATFIAPVNGSTNVNLSQPITWTNTAGAQAYYLYVGTAPGLKNLVDSAETQQTSWSAAAIPPNQTVYARIWTELDGHWYDQDISFAGVRPATFISPTNGATTVNLAQPITWASVSGAQAYYLYVGTVPGLKDVIDSAETQLTSWSAAVIPPNQTVYARIWTKLAGTWYFQDISFAGVRPATFSSPTNGATTVNLAQPITWTTVSGAQAYYLYVGTAPGLKDIIDSAETQLTSWSAAAIPPNQTVYARIWTKLAGAWYSQDISFSGVLRATFTSPANGTTNANLTLPIAWTSVPGAQAYYLYVGTAPGLKNIIDSFETPQTSWSAAAIPENQTVFARIHTKVAGQWSYEDISFSGTWHRAAFLSPTSGATSANLTLPIAWTSVPGAQAYYLYVGTAPGLKNIIDSYETPQTSWSASALPENQTVYARIHTKFGGAWSYEDISFSGTRQRAAFLAPTNGETTANLTLPIRWTSVPDAQAYYLYVGTAPGLKDIIDSNETPQTSWSAAAIPDHQTVYARIHTKLADHWSYEDIAFVGIRKATLTSPANGSNTANLARSIAWTSVTGAQAYYLYVGTAPGLKDIIDSYETQQTSWSAAAVPENQTVYARIWTKGAGSWYYEDSTFSGVRKAAFVSPTDGSTSVDLTQPITWTSVTGAQAYYLYIGTAPGLKNIIDSAETQQTSWSAAAVPPNQTAYARIWTKLAGAWYYEDISFVGH